MYHKPVLLKQSVELLKIHPGGTYVAATFGSGGHSRKILEELSDGQLFAFDQDEDAKRNTIADARFVLISQNFRFLKNFLKLHGASAVDGILADLGISSWQIDQPGRGFSTRYEGKLDMRMDQQQERTAERVVNEYPEEKIADILYQYGDIANSRKLANHLSTSRNKEPIQTTSALVKLALPFAPKGKENQFLARVFQAIRIEVNEELDALKDLLMQSAEILRPNGRVVIISYHSLEDKLVKNFFNTGNFEGRRDQDFFGNLISPLNPVFRKAIKPDDREMEENPRSRSARLRAAEKK